MYIILIIIIPFILAAYTHLWNPIGFPLGLPYDEGIYLRRTMNVLVGQGPQESSLYDHPYFGQLFLAGVLKMIGYPNSLNPSIGDVHSIEMLLLVPRIFMGLLAVVDTYIIYKICEVRYNNRTIGIIASTLFAVMPITWMIRIMWLESIQLPLFLSSILFAVYTKNSTDNHSIILKSLVSGIFLGLAIFTKIPILSMIPLTGFIIYTNTNRSLKVLGIWFIPVVLIPLIWPAYAINAGQFNLWLTGLYFQTHRGVQTLLSSLKYDFQIDPILLSLAVIGLFFITIKRDVILLLWVIPFIIFLYFVGFVSFWHLIPLLPAFSIMAARLIVNLSQIIVGKKIQQTVTFTVVSVLGIVGLTSTLNLIITSNDNTSYFKALAFVSQYLSNNNAHNEKISVVSNPFYSWIPKYVFHLNQNNYVDYYDNVLVKDQRVLLIVDPSFVYRLNHHIAGNQMEKNFGMYSKNKIAIFGGGLNDLITIYEYK